MVDDQPSSGQYISISDIILSLIESKIRMYMWNSVPPWTVSGIILRSHYMDLNSVAYIISLLVSMNMIFPPIMHPEDHFLKSKGENRK